jgi:hypothetical protein
MDSPPPMPPLPPPPESGPFAFPPPPEQAGPYGAPRGFYPLDFDGITRNSWSVFRFAWPTFLGAALIPNLIFYAITLPVQVAVWPDLYRFILEYQAAIAAGDIPTFDPGLLPTFGLLLLMGILGAVLSGLLVGSAVMVIGDSIFRGRPVTIRSALTTGVRRLPALLGAGLLYALAIFGVSLLGIAFSGLFIVGGGFAAFLGLVVLVGTVVAVVFIALRWSLLIQTVVLETQGAVEGLSRSWRLVAGSGWRVLGYAIFVALVSGVIGAVVGAIPETALRLSPISTPGIVLGTIFQGLLSVLVAPFALVTLFLYYDLRFRNGEAAPQPTEDRRQA